jgi:hypothetical protein
MTRNNRPHEETMAFLAIPLNGIDDPEEPEVSEINAGTLIVTHMTADGWQPNWTKNTVSTDMMDGFIVQSVGTEGFAATLQFARQDDDTDTTRGTLARREQFWLAVVPFAGLDEDGDYNEVEVGTIVDLYHCESHGIQDVASGANTDQQYQVQLAGKSRPHLDVAVVVDAT